MRAPIPDAEVTAVLGISTSRSRAGAALIRDGEVVAVAEEDSFPRDASEGGVPLGSIEHCLRAGGIEPAQVDYVGFHGKPLLELDRLLETYLARAPAGFRSFLETVPRWLDRELSRSREVGRALRGAFEKRYVYCEELESRAAEAFFSSPFEEAAILVHGGTGEWATAGWGVGRGRRIELGRELRYPHSLGDLYAAFADYCGCDRDGGEELMVLATRGEPRHVDRILDEVVDLKADGSFRLDASLFVDRGGATRSSTRLHSILGGPPRTPPAPVEPRHADVAASIQAVVEEVLLRCGRHLRDVTGQRHLCLAGGVAVNCLAGGRLVRDGPFDDVWIQPEAGVAVGAALFIWHQLLDNPRTPRAGDSRPSAQADAGDVDETIRSFLEDVGADPEWAPDDATLCDRAATALAKGEVVGWFEDRDGPGLHRSRPPCILGDARDASVRERIARRVVMRNGSQLPALAVLAERAHEIFDLRPGQASPRGTLAAALKDGAAVATQAGGLTRIRTVERGAHGFLRGVLERFAVRSGCPALCFEHLGLDGDPPVRSPRGAYDAFLASGLDVLCLGRAVLRKSKQPATVGRTTDGTSDEVLEGKLASPCCRAELTRREGRLVCRGCGHLFETERGIPRLFWPHDSMGEPGDVTKVVEEFYGAAPFPDYDDHDSVSSLVERSRRGLYARRLDEAIPKNCDVLEIGCGTGQLTNFLGIACRRVIGADLCLRSLELGEAFRKEQGLARVRFVHMNLFRPPFAASSFDVVVCHGVLHHTSDPQAGFRHLAPLVRPGGYVIVGLYHRLGRLPTKLRRFASRLTMGRTERLDPHVRTGGLGARKRGAWLADQYRHPHESSHSFGAVLRWFDECELDFVRGIPAMRLEDDGLEAGLFEPQPRGNVLDRALAEATHLIAGRGDGGLFVMIGRRRFRAS